ncbi:hypothetical protein BDP27DRAFT_1360763 [Rhodocollybia butyracea]|uniref:Uncharacterized protein n=1 Tax=Rhodocollybia butyracea TaxID=206335 RepID=A0A9P5PUK7_9AGAR|nr:hypothetical protein BDP27DRAFT_1360763 [Rhodocollybia butyracea]
MYQQSNSSLISVNSDELRWLDADAILQESSTTEASPSRATPSSRYKNAKRHHYQRSTKSSSAKVVNRMSGSFNRRHSRSNLNYIVTPSVSSSSYLPTSTLESPKLSASASLPIKTPPRLAKRSGSYSSTHSGSPGSEWIYRRPKSPSAASPPRVSAVRYARRTVSDSTNSTSTPSPASTADSSRCVTPTSGTYRSGLAASYFPDVSTSCLNVSSSSLPAHLVNSSRDASINGSGSSVGSIGSIGVLIPSSFGLNASASSLSHQPSASISRAPSTSGKTGTFWTSILHPRSGPNSTIDESSSSRMARLTLGKSKDKPQQQQPQPSSPLAIHTAQTIPSIWSGANLEGATGMSPKRRKARGSLKELGISRIPVSSRITSNHSQTSPLSLSPPIYNTPVKRRTSHTRSESMSSTTSSTTSSSVALSNSASSLSLTPSSPPPTPVSPTIASFGKTKKFQPKFEPHHRAIVEVVEDDDASHMDIQRRKSPSPTKSILASRTPYSETLPENKFDSGIDLGLESSIRKRTKRKDSVSTTISNKSVKFAEQPTVHYASAIYEYWDGTNGPDPFDYEMGIDVGGMDMDTRNDDHLSEETAHQHSYIRHPYAASDLSLADAADEVSTQLGTFNSRVAHSRGHGQEEACATPTPDRGRERILSGTGTLRSFASLKRKKLMLWVECS